MRGPYEEGETRGESPGTRLVLVEDHELLAHSLSLALRAEGFVVDAPSLTERSALVEQICTDPPDLVLLDLELGGDIGDGATLVRPFVSSGSKVLVVSGSTDRCRLATAVEQGAVGVLSKNVAFETLVSGVIRAARGEELMTADERQRLLDELRHARTRRRRLREPLERLSRREDEVLQALCRGRSVSHIARDWVVSEATVRSQVRGVLTKLEVNSQLEAVAHALRAGWVTPDDPAPRSD